MLRKSRGAREIQNLGEYYVLDTDRNSVADSRVDIESRDEGVGRLGRIGGVMKPDCSTIETRTVIVKAVTRATSTR